MHMYRYKYTCRCTYIYMFRYIYICSYIYIYMFLYIYIHTPLHICTALYIHVYIPIYVYIYVLLHMYIYTYMQESRGSLWEVRCIHMNVFLYIHICMYSLNYNRSILLYINVSIPLNTICIYSLICSLSRNRYTYIYICNSFRCSLYIHVSISLYTYIHISVHAYTHIYTWDLGLVLGNTGFIVYKCIHIHIPLHIYTLLKTYVYISIHIYTYIRNPLHVYICERPGARCRGYEVHYRASLERSQRL